MMFPENVANARVHYVREDAVTYCGDSQEEQSDPHHHHLHAAAAAAALSDGCGEDAEERHSVTALTVIDSASAFYIFFSLR